MGDGLDLLNKFRTEGGVKHKMFSFDIIYERAPEDEQVEKNRL